MGIRLVLADDHTMVLEGLTAILSLEPDIEVVAQCVDGAEAVSAVVEHAPDVLVLDATMPRCSGVEAVERLVEADRVVPTIILSAALDDATLLRCMELGVRGVILKEAATARLTEAVRTVASGRRWIPPMLAARALELMARPAGDDGDALTPRERAVMLSVAQGASNKRAAADLGIAEGTVKFHLHNAYRKLGVSNRVQLTLLARKRGWV